MKIVVVKNSNDPRIALIPADIKKLVAAAHECFFVKGSGIDSGFSDEEYVNAGASVLGDNNALYEKLKEADLVVSTKIIDDDKVINSAVKSALFITSVNSFLNAKLLEKYKKLGLQVFAMELLPRITRTQNMDILSSQSNIAGYKAVIEAVHEYGRVCPMMTTAAGTIRPARFLVIGAGVAGLQAIATAKRLGGVVYVFDVRAAAKEQVESLGGVFVEVESKENLESKDGYAKETSEEYKKAQQIKLEEEIKKADIVITTANIPGRAAPKLVTKEMIKSMKNGAVIVDLAAEMGGNTELTECNKRIKKGGVLIIGDSNMPALVAESSSSLFSRNVFNLINHIIKDNKLDKSDEALSKCYL